MKRDLDLIRRILLRAERLSKDSRRDLSFAGPTFEEFSTVDSRVLLAHVRLCHQAGFLGQLARPTEDAEDGYQRMGEGLTWLGFEALELCRDEYEWEKARSIIENRIGSAPFEVWLDVLRKIKAEGIAA